MKVSIIINNYNYVEFIEEAISSSLEQDSSTDVEVIVVDDGSTDNSRAVIEAYADRITPVFKENGGQASAFNAGYEACTGDIICFLDADDYFYPQKIAEISQLFQKYSAAGWCFHELEDVDRNGDPHYRKKRRINKLEFVSLRRVLINGTELQHQFTATSGLCFRKCTLEAIFPIPEDFKIAADSYVRLVAVYLYPGVLSPARYAVHRKHNRNLYDFREDVRVSKARVHLKSAYYLWKRFPSLSIYTNKQYHNAVSTLVDTIGLEQTLNIFEARAYLRQTKSARFRLKVALKVAKMYARQRMHRTKSMILALKKCYYPD